MPLFDRNTYTKQAFENLTADAEHMVGTSFQECAFTDCTFSECTLEKCRFEGCTFKGCDLSLVKLPLTHFKQTGFRDCRLVGVNWCDANWEVRSLLSPKHVDFDACLLDHSLFIGLGLKGTDFNNCHAHGVDFEGADLTRANFRAADLMEARFVGCDLTEADFTRARGYAINAAANTLHKTKFSLPEAVALLHSLDIILED